jgi:hypothetical protein
LNRSQTNFTPGWNKVISDRAKDGIRRIFLKAAAARLAPRPGDACRIEPLPPDKTGNTPEEHIVILTISSLSFRLLVILHVDETPATRACFAGEAAVPFREAFYEIANLCGGAINQELQRYFPDLGMSTPYTLGGRCIDFLGALKPAYLSRHAISINESVRMSATLCLCAYAPVDFAYDDKVVEETAGELELF